MTPRELGFRMPAEWEKQAAIWLTWPTNPALWPGHFDLLLPQYAAFVAAISRARRSIVSTGTFVMREAHAGVFGVLSGPFPRMYDL